MSKDKSLAEYVRRMLPVWRARGVREIILSPAAYDELVRAGLPVSAPDTRDALAHQLPTLRTD
jgi:hypothetical protein